jgi:AraC-like DNA-binding protein
MLLYNMSMDFYDDIQLLAGSTGTYPDRPIRLKNRDYYCLQYNHSGRITVRIGDEAPRQARAPSILITHPYGTFSFGVEPEGSWHHNYVAFRGDRVERYIESGLLPVRRPLRLLTDSRAFLAAFEICVAHTRAGRNDRAAHALEEILLLMREQRSPGAEGEVPSVRAIQGLARRIRNRPSRRWRAAAEARRVHLSTAHFRRLFKQVAGAPLGQYVLQCRLSYAADMLATTSTPIKQIASDAGMGSVHYFTRVFGRQYHVPPARFRQEIRGRAGVD